MVKQLDNPTVNLEIDDLLRGQGMDPQKASTALTKFAVEALEEARSLIKPAALYRTLPVLDYQHETVIFDGGSFSGALVARAFAGATNLTMAICTIGPALEKRSDEVSPASLMQALALDGAGTAAVEILSRQLAKKIKEDAAKSGFKTGMKANPGQEGWSIEQQRVLFKLIPAEQIGVKLNDSALMIPRKSVSFVIGMGEEMCAEAVPCDFCSKREHCQWRKEKASSG